MPPRILPQHGLDLLRGEQIIGPFHAAAVRILTTEETALLSLQFPQTVVQGALRHAAVQGDVPILPGLGVHQGQQGVVVKRLFKMGSQPLPVCGVAGKAPAEMVIDPAPVHLPQAVVRHLAELFVLGVIAQPQQKQQVVGGGELGCGAEAAGLLVIGTAQLLRRGLQLVRPRLGRGEGRLVHHKVPHLVGGGKQILPVPVPLGRNGPQQGDQPRLTMAAFPGNIGAGKEGQLLRRHDDGQGPAAVAGEGHTHLHIHAVHIGPLLPVHLHRHIVAVQQRRHLLILKALMGHHMAPVTGGIADGQEDGLVLLLCLVKCFRPPGQPVHRVFTVLAQIGGTFLA